MQFHGIRSHNIENHDNSMQEFLKMETSADKTVISTPENKSAALEISDLTCDWKDGSEDKTVEDGKMNKDEVNMMPHER